MRAVDEHVHEVGLDVSQDARVVGDEQHAETGVRLRAVDALGDDLERVDVEAGVGLVEHREVRLQQLELQDLVALLLAAREALVDVALGERLVHPEVRHRLATSLTQVRTDGRLAVDRGLRGAEEVRDGHAGDLDGVLHREEEAGAGTRVDRHLEHVLAVEQDLALDDVVLRVAGDRVGERGLAGAVRAHDRVDLALLDDEVDAAEDLARALVGLDVDVQVLDLEHRHGSG